MAFFGYCVNEGIEIGFCTGYADYVGASSGEGEAGRSADTSASSSDDYDFVSKRAGILLR